MTAAQIRSFFDETTKTVSYLVWDPRTRDGAAIDPVLDFDLATGEVTTLSAERLLAAAAENDVNLRWALETHAHADHLTAGALLRRRTGARVAIGEHIREVQTIFAPVFDADDLRPDGADFDVLLRDGDRLPLGGLEIEVLHTPGHTPACVSYRIGDAVFVGDTLFMPDYGTARADFPGGDARQLHRSIRRLLALPPETRLFMCHDYKAPGRDAYAWETTVAEERASNVHIHDGVSEDEFAAMRQARDATLAAPALLLPSIQVNIRAGRFPPPEPDGARFVRVPVKARSPAAAEALAA
ncbi:MAG TPA: MBL fold metallo-hydrolase [Caulobacteraceae bacterium]|nr:MBL fold metallo-hydrolase [Caulobacteraceae bacterium]